MIDVGSGNNIKSIIKRLFFGASVYHIWQEGNNRIFKDSKRSSEEVFKSIVEMIKLKLIGTTVKDSIAVVPSILEFFWHDCTYLSPIACLDWPGGIETGCVWLDRRSGPFEYTIR
ncbi:hypothetical protein Tco_0165478 [Tanacetum coccineum]